MDVEVRGWQTEAERMALRRWAFGLQVLEIGAFEGLSTMQLAITATHVTTIDTFDGRGTVHSGSDTEVNFHRNMQACGLSHKVLPIKGESLQVMSRLEQVFDLVYIDGSHDYESVRADAEAARKLLKPGGFLAFHDYDLGHPGVQQVVDALVQDGFHSVDQSERAVLLKEGVSQRKAVNVAVLLPSYNGWFMHAGVQTSAWNKASESTRCNHTIFKPRGGGSSVLTSCFNKMTCEAMNARELDGFTHLAMMHADVNPDPCWLDVLVEELEVGRFDMVSAVIPIKDHKGLTSTGLSTPVGRWAVRRLTMHEVFDLPETFTAADIPWRAGEENLLLNSGCFVMRFDRPWFSGLCWRQQDRIVKVLTTGKYGNESQSEDWDWSRQLIDRGCRLAATRKVGLFHERPEFHNRAAWGTWECDHDFIGESVAFHMHQGTDSGAAVGEDDRSAVPALAASGDERG